MEGGEVPHHPHLQTAHHQQSVQSDEGGVEVSISDIDDGHLGGAETIPERQDSQSDTTQADQHEDDVKELEAGIRNDVLLSEVGHSAQMVDELGEVVQRHNAQSHTVEREKVSCGDENQIENGVDRSRTDLLFFRLLEVEFRELMHPVGYLNEIEELHPDRHFSMNVRISGP